MEFVKCSKCGKKLIVRKDDGTLQFIFGRRNFGETPVDITIDGNVMIRCIRNGCQNIERIMKEK